MRELRRVLKADGLLIISTPDKRYYSEEPKTTNEFHVKELYEAEFRDLLARHFRNVRVMHQPSFPTTLVKLTPKKQVINLAITIYEGGSGKIFQKPAGLKRLPLCYGAIASDRRLAPHESEPLRRDGGLTA